jgi:hypothetical protein
LKKLTLIIAAALLLLLCSCDKWDFTNPENLSSLPEELTFFQSIVTIDNVLYHTDTTDGSTGKVTVLRCMDADVTTTEIGRLRGVNFFKYIEGSLEASRGKYLYFFVNTEESSGSIYAVDVQKNSLFSIAAEPCSTMAIRPQEPQIGWVLHDNMLVPIDLATAVVNNENRISLLQGESSIYTEEGLFFVPDKIRRIKLLPTDKGFTIQVDESVYGEDIKSYSYDLDTGAILN